MKKSLIALAALAAVSAASAQSTVTISGAMVLGVGATELGTAASDLQIVRQTGNLSLDGSEDLGGGLKAGFRLQTSIGAVATTNQTTSGIVNQRNILGDRGAYMSLNGGFGTVLVGRAATSIRSQMGIADVSGLPVVTGLSAASSGETSSTAGRTAIAAGDTNAAIIYGDDYANQVAYQSPSFSGFNVSVGTVPTQTVSTGVGDDSTGKDTISYTLNYSNGPLNASVNLTDAAGGTAPYQITTIVANYDLGVAKIGVAQQSIRLDSGTNPGNGTMITANIPMGQGAFGLGYGRRVASASSHASFAGDDVKQSFVGYKYNLSKRTAISATYNNIDRAGTTTDLKETHILVGHSF
jgi:predicted porin